MRKSIVLSFFFLLPFIGLAQNQGQFALGVSSNASWGGLRGYQPSFALHAGKFIAKNFEVGVNTSFAGNQYPRNSLYQYGTPTSPDGIGTVKNRSLGLNGYSKYYFGDRLFRPFAQGELGLIYRSQIRATSDANAKEFTISPHIALGAGVSSFLGKNRRAALEVSYLIQNVGKIPNIDFPNQKNKALEGRLNIGFKYILK